MSDDLANTGQSFTGQVRELFYLLDESVATLTIQINRQAITARAYGQIALDLRALPRGAMIRATLCYEQPDSPQLIAFTVIPS